jgi:hypothetical protein
MLWGVLRDPEGETESQLRPPLVPDALTEISIVLVSVIVRKLLTGVVLPAVAVNENDVGERVSPPPPS